MTDIANEQSANRRREARIALARHLGQESDRSARNATSLALVHVEIDGAADAESRLGPRVSKAMVASLRARLVRALRSYDLVTVLGPKSLAVVLSDVRGGPTIVSCLVERLHEALAPPVRLPVGNVPTSCRIGVAMGQERLHGAEMIRRAAVAVARASDAGGVAYHDRETDAEMRLRREFHADLRRDIADGAIRVAYQPLYDADGEGPAGVEALARWSRNGVPVPPDVFIAHAEETGMIRALGEAVLRKACEAGAQWADISVAVNVSPSQLADPQFPMTVETILEETGFEAARLEIEITEGVLASDPEMVASRLSALRSLGVRIALDDFGTGFSGLGYLRRFPFDRLKIDRSFVADGGVTSKAIIEAVLGMSRAMGFEVTAEGIETETQRAYLVERGCNRLQGYLLGRPTSEEAISLLLDAPSSPSP